MNRGIHHVTSVEAEREPLLHLALGARGLVDRIEAILDRHAPAAGCGENVGGVTNDVAVVLGVLAIARHLTRALDSIDEPVAVAAAAARERETSRGWLR